MAKKFNSALPSVYIWKIPSMLAAAKVGIDKKKETFAESNLSYPKILPAEIVIPALLTPGTKAKI